METDLIELNVGGSVYTTLRKTLLSENGSLFHDLLVTNSIEFLKDSNGRIFIDRDGNLFKYVLDYLRNKNSVSLDTNVDKLKLKGEADYFKLYLLWSSFECLAIYLRFLSSSLCLVKSEAPASPNETVLVLTLLLLLITASNFLFLSFLGFIRTSIYRNKLDFNKRNGNIFTYSKQFLLTS